jgi:hypothetical protein
MSQPALGRARLIAELLRQIAVEDAAKFSASKQPARGSGSQASNEADIALELPVTRKPYRRDW